MSRVDVLLGPMNKQTQWRVTVGGTVALLCVFALWSLGLFGGLGFPGMARAADVQQVAGDVKEIRVSQLSASIFGMRRDQCAAIKDGRAATAYTQQLHDLLDKYFYLQGRPFDLPGCNEL